MSWDDCHDLLRQLHFFYRRKIILLWDNLPLHYAVAESFADEQPGWFDFQYFPTYSPELNPVEQCWQWIKNVELTNFLPANRFELTLATCAAANTINHSKTLLPSFFKHAGITP
jgi:transposase